MAAKKQPAKKPTPPKQARKPAATKAKSKAAPAKKNGTPKAKPGPDPVMTKAQRAIRDLTVIEMKIAGVERHVIGEKVGLGVRQVDKIWKEYNTSPIDWQNHDPREFVNSIIRRANVRWEAAAYVATVATKPNEVLAAIRTMGQIEEQITQLYVVLGLIPRDLGAFQWIDDVRKLILGLIDSLDQLESGEVTIAEVRSRFAEFVGVTPNNEIEAGT